MTCPSDIVRFLAIYIAIDRTVRGKQEGVNDNYVNQEVGQRLLSLYIHPVSLVVSPPQIG